MDYNPFEEMLRRRHETSHINTNPAAEKKAAPPTKAAKSASLDDFIEMADKMVTKTMGDLQVFFMPDDQNQALRDQAEKINHPYITYKVVNREPAGELKPRIREEIFEKGHDPKDNRQGEVWGQKFTCDVQFNIFASEYKTAQRVMKRFEENMFKYQYFFMKNGVQQLLFKRQFEDKNYAIFRENISVRSLLYTVSIENLIVGFNTEIEDISIQ